LNGYYIRETMDALSATFPCVRFDYDAHGEDFDADDERLEWD